MTSKQNENFSGIENQESELTPIDLYNGAQDKLNNLSKIDPGNNNLASLNELIPTFIDNADALKFINKGLAKINEDVVSIDAEGKQLIAGINKKLFNSIEEADINDTDLGLEELDNVA